MTENNNDDVDDDGDDDGGPLTATAILSSKQFLSVENVPLLSYFHGIETFRLGGSFISLGDYIQAIVGWR